MSDMLIKRSAIHIQKLEIRPPGIGSTAQDDDTAILPFKIRLDRIKTHIRVDGHCIGTIALESLARILFCSGADVTPFGVEYDGYLRVLRFQIITNRLQLIFRRHRREIGDLRLERTGGRSGGINDRLAKVEDGIAAAAQVFGEPLRIRIEADAQQGIICLDGGSEFVSEFHAR